MFHLGQHFPVICPDFDELPRFADLAAAVEDKIFYYLVLTYIHTQYMYVFKYLYLYYILNLASHLLCKGVIKFLTGFHLAHYSLLH